MHPKAANVADVSKLRQVLNLLWAERYGYPFDEWVADRRDRGASWRNIENEINDLLGIPLTNVTLLKWYGEKSDRGAA